jgi:hypothetical protein
MVCALGCAVDDQGLRPWTPGRIHKAFDELRTELAKRHESFKTTSDTKASRPPMP